MSRYFQENETIIFDTNYDLKLFGVYAHNFLINKIRKKLLMIIFRGSNSLNRKTREACDKFQILSKIPCQDTR